MVPVIVKHYTRFLTQVRCSTYMLLALLNVVFALPAAAQKVSVIATHVLPVPSVTIDSTHHWRLYIYTFQGSRWVVPQIGNAVGEAGQLLAQCGIALAGAELHELQAPRRFHFYSTRVSRELLRDLPTTKPAVFFVEDNLNQPSFDAEAIGRANAGGRPELTDTVWIAHGTADLAIALAHELVHVLSNSGAHSDASDNLMRAETAPGNIVLNREQCSSLRSRGEANGLLTPRVLKP